MKIEIERDVVQQALLALETCSGVPHWPALQPAITPLREALAAPQPAQQEPVAYLDVGDGGYLDIGSELTDLELSKLPKGRHLLVIAGTFGVDDAAQAPQPPQRGWCSGCNPDNCQGCGGAPGGFHGITKEV